MFTPHLEILPDALRRLWPELQQTPAHFVLYGGTALALRLGHRQSIDFDFFSRRSFVPSGLATQIPYLRDAEIVQSAANTLTCRVDRRGDVLVSFFGGLTLGVVQPAEPAIGPGVAVASLVDLGATKVKVVLDRASAKDYLDIDVLLQSGIALAELLTAAKAVYGAPFDPTLSLKALAYFDDGDVRTLPAAVKERLLEAVRAVDISRLPRIAPISHIQSPLETPDEGA